MNALFAPGVPIHDEALRVQGYETPEQQAMARAKIEQAPTFKGSAIYLELQEYLKDPETVLVAHNAPFDIGMLTREGMEVPRFICTLKVWRWMDGFNKLKKHTLQFLREHYGLQVEAKAHDAMGDVIVLEALFNVAVDLILKNKKDMDRDAALKKMEAVTGSSLLLKKMPFGKHKGKLFSDLPKSYLEWILSKGSFDSDILLTAQHHLRA